MNKLEKLYIHRRVAPQHCHFCWPWTSCKYGSPGTLAFQGSQPVDIKDVNGRSTMQALPVVRDALRLAQDVFAGHGQAGGEVSALQRAAQVAGEPLVPLGRSVAATAIGYLGSNTAVAKGNGLGALRLDLQTKAAPGRRFAWAVIMHVSDLLKIPDSCQRQGSP